MATKRTPINRKLRQQISPEAVEAFRRMEAARGRDGVRGSEAWWAAHSLLHSALGLRPWQWPAFEYPDEECPYPRGCHAAEHWQQRRDERPEAFELYHALAEAAQTQRKETA